MSDNVIYTEIKNNAPIERTLRWTGEGPVCVEAGSTISVPYEVWSVADRQQREAILAETQSGDTELTICIKTCATEYTRIKFNPSIILDPLPAVRVEAQPAVSQVSQSIVAEMQEDDKRHTIKAHAHDGGHAAEVYGVKVEQPDDGAVAGIRTEGASTNGFMVDTDTEVRSTRAKLAAQVPMEETAEGDKLVAFRAVETIGMTVANPEAVIEEPLADRFNALTKEKKWEDALNLLIEAYGKDKVKFTARAIMSLKTFEAVAKKYGLE